VSRPVQYTNAEVGKFKAFYKTDDLQKAVKEFESYFVEMPNAMTWLDYLEKLIYKEDLPWQSLHIAFDFRIAREEYEVAANYKWVLKYWESKGLNDCIQQ